MRITGKCAFQIWWEITGIYIQGPIGIDATVAMNFM